MLGGAVEPGPDAAKARSFAKPRPEALRSQAPKLGGVWRNQAQPSPKAAGRLYGGRARAQLVVLIEPKQPR